MRLFKLALTIALAMFIIDGATAQADTFYSSGSGGWRDNGAWLTDRCGGSTSAGADYPQAGDTATICAGHTISMSNNEAVMVLSIAGTLNTGSNTLTISGGSPDLDVTGSGVLNINDQGVVLISSAAAGHSIATDARIYLLADESVFRFTANTTIDGAGAIVGSDDSAGIEIGDSVIFTNSTTIQGRLEIRDVAEQSGSFANDGTVEANVNGGLLLVKVHTVDDTDGDDRWKATLANAELDLSADITTLGPMEGEFVITAGEIELNEPLTTTGRLDISGGTFDVNYSVTMGSDLLEHFLSQTGGTIDVAYAKTFTHY